MTVKSICYEDLIASLIDACDLVDNRNEKLSIKRSFTTKQDIFSNALHERLLNYLSGNTLKLMNRLSDIFEVLNEAMKNMSSSPLPLQMSKEAYNHELTTTIIIPFIALLLFEMRFEFNRNSVIYYFIEFLSNDLSIEKNLDHSIRKYIKEKLVPLNLPNGIGTEFITFIGKISLKSALKKETITNSIEILKQDCNCNKQKISDEYLDELSKTLQAMRLILYFQEHVKNLSSCYLQAKFRLKNENMYWAALEEISKKILSIKNKKNPKHHIKFNKVVGLSEMLSRRYHKNLHNKHDPYFDVLLNHIMDGDFKRDYSIKLLQSNQQQKDSIYYKMIEFNVNVYDKEFILAEDKLSTILIQCESHPNSRLMSDLYKLYIALHIKNDQIKIKHNELSFYINKVISTDYSKEKMTLIIDNCFFDQDSPFITDANFYTILDSISEWHDYLKNSLEIDVSKSDGFDVDFSKKIEIILEKIYTAIDTQDRDLEYINHEDLKNIINSEITTNELIDNIITFLPNLSLYHSLRDIGYLYPSFSVRTKRDSKSINRFLLESVSAKRNLLRALSPSCYVIDKNREDIIH